jgi:hypothetical protein
MMRLGGVVVSPEVSLRDEKGRFLARAVAGAESAAAALADEIADAARMLAPYRSGELYMSIDAEYAGTRAWATANAAHAGVQEYGAGPHDIPNSFGRGPSFGIGGSFSGMFHPGNPGTYYMETAGEDVSARSVGIVAAHMP